MSLRVVLLLRGAFDVLFALYLLMSPTLTGVWRGGSFSLGDGLLALLVAVTLSKHPHTRWLYALALVDALIRIVTGVVAFAYPNIESRIIGAVAYFGTIITVCIALGVVGMIYTYSGRAVAGTPTEIRRGTAWSAFLSSLFTLLLGLVLVAGFAGGDDRRTVVGIYALALGLTFLAAGARAKASPAV